MAMTSREIADEIRMLYARDPDRAPEMIRHYLEQALPADSPDEKLAGLQKVIEEFNGGTASRETPSPVREPVLARLFALVLGGRVSEADLASEEVLERLADSLNELFDTLNRLTASIDATLGNGSKEGKTIRHVIGEQLDRESRPMSLERHLGRISQAFFQSHEAFQEAARKLVGDILADLDPERIDEQLESTMKFGPLKKANCFDAYRKKYERCRDWYRSERFTTDLLREFEKRCQASKT